MAEEVGRDSVHGVLVATVVPGGPAWLSGMEVGDIITGINGSSMIVTSGEDISLPIISARNEARLYMFTPLTAEAIQPRNFLAVT